MQCPLLVDQINVSDSIANVEFLDFNGDGKVDVLVDDAFYLNQGSLTSPSFSGATSNSYLNQYPCKWTINGSPSIYKKRQVKDINGDGLADIICDGKRLRQDHTPQGLIAVDSSSNNVVLLNASQGGSVQFNKKTFQQLGVSTSHDPSDVFNLFLDINGDGLEDYLFIDNSLRTWHVQLFDGLVYKTAINTGSKAGIEEIKYHSGYISAPVYSDLITSGDYNGDGRNELYVKNKLEVNFCTIVYVNREGREPEVACSDPNDSRVPSGSLGLRVTDSFKDQGIYSLKRINFNFTETGSVSLSSLNTSILSKGNSTTGYADLRNTGLLDKLISLQKKYVVGAQSWQTGSSSTYMELSDINGFQEFGYYAYLNKGSASSLSDSNNQQEFLKKVREGSLTEAEWEYATLSVKDSGSLPFYETDFNYVEGGSEPGYFHFRSSMPAVRSFSISNGVSNGKNKLKYYYKGAVFNKLGRGFQGFRSIVVDDEVTGKRSSTVFHQKFPLSGKIESLNSCLIVNGGNSCSQNKLTSTTIQYQTANPVAGTHWSVPTLTVEKQYSRDTGTAGHELIKTTTTNAVPTGQDLVYGNVKNSTVSITTNSQARTRQDSLGASYKNTIKTTSINEYDYSYVSDWWINKPNSIAKTQHKITSITGYPAMTSEQNDDETVTTSFIPGSQYWDTSARKPKRVITTPGDSSKAVTTTTEYDTYGLPKSVTVATSGETARTTTTSYIDENYFIGKITSGETVISEVAEGDVDKATGTILKSTDINGLVSEKGVDGFGRETFTKVAGVPRVYSRIRKCSGSSGNLCNVSNNNAAFYIETTQFSAPKVREYKDILGRTVENWVQDFTGNSWIKTRVDYDTQGRTTFESVPNIGSISAKGVKYEYNDNQGRMTKQTTDMADSFDLVTTYRYRGASTLITATSNGSSRQMSRTYNGLGQLIETVDADGGQVKYSYDNQGNPVVIQGVDGHKITASYDALGHKNWVNDPDMGQKSFIYNGFGELRKETDAKNQVTESLFDTLGNLYQRKVDNVVQGTWKFHYSRPEADRPNKCLGSLYQEIGGITRVPTYDNYCRISQLSETVDGHIFVSKYTFDSQSGKPKTKEYPNAVKVEYSYNDQGFLTTTKNSTSNVIYQKITETDARGNWTTAQYHNNSASITRYYDAASGQMKQTILKDGGSNTQIYNYDYRGFGNLYAQDNWLLNTGSNIETFEYDNLHRLRKSSVEFGTGGGVSVDYHFDKSGNLKKKSDFSVNNNDAYSYGHAELGAGAHAPWKVALKSGGNRYYRYDANGNMIHEYNNDWSLLRSITYNALNKPTKIEVHSSQKLSPSDPNKSVKGHYTLFNYDANYQRYKQYNHQPGKTPEQTYYLMGGEYEFIKRSTATNKRVYIDGHTVINQKGSLIETTSFHKDHLGSIVGIFSTNGSLLETHSFDPFGKPRDGGFKEKWRSTLNGQMYPVSGTGNSKANADKRTSRGFTSHEQLDDVQYTHMNGRIYDYNLARFLSVDPIIQSPGNSQSLNPYSYILNNPLSGTDPSGYVAREGSSNGVDSTKTEKKVIKVDVSGSRIKQRVGVLTTTTTTSGGTTTTSTIFEGENGAIMGTVTTSAGNTTTTVTFAGDSSGIDFTATTTTEVPTSGLTNPDTQNSTSAGAVGSVSAGSLAITSTANAMDFSALKNFGKDILYILGRAGVGLALFFTPSEMGDPQADPDWQRHQNYWLAVSKVISPEEAEKLMVKMKSEISGLLQKNWNAMGYQYSLRAATSGYYVCHLCFSGKKYLEAGEVWKYGESLNPDKRYTQDFYRTNKVSMVREFRGTRIQIKIVEKMKIYNYFLINKRLPPGNKVFR